MSELAWRISGNGWVAMDKHGKMASLVYGGWGSYELWADNGFLPRGRRSAAPEDEPIRVEPEPAPQVEAASMPVPAPRAKPAPMPTTPTTPPRGSARAEPVPSEVANYPNTGNAPNESRHRVAVQFAQVPAGVSGAEPQSPKDLVRPYARTGGRTRTKHPLAVETLLSVPNPDRVDLRSLEVDHRTICLACRTPQSMAELAVLLKLPLGAARVLVDDLIELRILNVHHTAGRPSVEMMERVLTGLRRLA